MFLTMLATFDRHGQLKPDSEIKSLGVFMALYIRLVEVDDLSFLSLEDLDLASHILAYANKHSIVLQSAVDMQDIIDQLQPQAEQVKLPASDAKKNDPWNWNKIFGDYKKARGPMGGDKLDVTTWSPAERRAASYDKKDPVSRSMMASLKKELVMQSA